MFLDADHWQHGSAEALCQTIVDLFLFDRLSVHQEAIAFKNLWLQAEVNLTAKSVSGGVVARGSADYVLGYPRVDSGNSDLENTLIVVEAKRPDTMHGGIAQCAGYLGKSMIQILEYRSTY